MKKSLLLLFFCLVIWAVKAQSIDVAAEFADATVVYVSYANGTDATGRGNFSAPYKTIRYALQQATGKTWIKVSSGTQTENAICVLKSNVMVDGGYTYNASDAWTRASESTRTTVNITAIESSSTYCKSRIGFKSEGKTGWVLCNLAVNVTGASTSDRTADGRGASVYGVYISGASDNTYIINSNITVGNGGSGANGTTGSDGAAGAKGNNGGDGKVANAGSGGSGAFTNGAGGAGGNGGDGGKGKNNGSKGTAGTASGGSGGSNAGAGGSYGSPGSNGSAGANGGDGSNGSAGSNDNQYLWGAFFQPANNGTNGTNGTSGGGAQGGGGGGGNKWGLYGGGGGGQGGQGGGGGQGGAAGGSGGGSFKIYC